MRAAIATSLGGVAIRPAHGLAHPSGLDERLGQHVERVAALEVEQPGRAGDGLGHLDAVAAMGGGVGEAALGPRERRCSIEGAREMIGSPRRRARAAPGRWRRPCPRGCDRARQSRRHRGENGCADGRPGQARARARSGTICWVAIPPEIPLIEAGCVIPEHPRERHLGGGDEGFDAAGLVVGEFGGLLERLLCARGGAAVPRELRGLDGRRPRAPDRFRGPIELGGAAEVERDHLRELGVAFAGRRGCRPRPAGALCLWQRGVRDVANQLMMEGVQAALGAVSILDQRAVGKFGERRLRRFGEQLAEGDQAKTIAEHGRPLEGALLARPQRVDARRDRGLEGVRKAIPGARVSFECPGDLLGEEGVAPLVSAISRASSGSPRTSRAASSRAAAGGSGPCPWARGTPNTGTSASPMNFSTRPPWASRVALANSKNGASIRRASSGSRPAMSSVDPTRSAKNLRGELAPGRVGPTERCPAGRAEGGRRRRGHTASSAADRHRAKIPRDWIDLTR